jgi:predicted PurR-regulated permease PerM
MSIGYHANITFGALKRWFISQCYDSLAVAAMWLVALLFLHVPFALLWALLAGAFQFIPNFGTVLALVGPAMALLLTGADKQRLIGLLIAYALIAIIDGLVLQPYLMKRQNRVPWWASTFIPIIMGFIIPFWGVLIAPPMLAIFYAYRKPKAPEPMRAGEGIILPPDRTR